MEKLVRAKELKRLIEKYDYQYYELGNSEISDAEYDRLYNEYLQLEKEFPELKEMKDAPSKKVGAGKEAGSTTGLPKFTHKSPLLSIDRKAKELEELKDFYDKCGGDGTELLIQPKLDGITCNINYENGLFVNAATRGDGYIGELITNNFLTTSTKYPDEIPNTINLELRGEAILPYNEFLNLNLELKANNKETLSNPRNAVAGFMRRLNSNETENKRVKVIFYDIGLNNISSNITKDTEYLNVLNNFGFQTVPIIKVNTWKALKHCVETKMDGLIQELDGFNVLVSDDYPSAVCDGLVIKVNDINLRNEIGMSEKGPKWCFAYKFKPLQAETRIDHIEWSIGKTGRLVPTAVFDEIILGGTKIKRATLNNYDYMKNLPVLGKYGRIVSTDIGYSVHYEYLEYNKPIHDIRYIRPGDILIDSKFLQSQGEEECKIIKIGDIHKDGDGFYISEPYIYSGEWYPFEKDRYYFKPDKGLQMDDVIIVERSNDVIPRIVAIKNRGNFVYTDDLETSIRIDVRRKTFNIPDVCPYCGSKIIERYPLHYCTNNLCSSQMKRKIEHYVSREAMNIVGLGEGIIDTLYNNGFITDIPSIYHLASHKQELEKLQKFGEKKVQKILDSIESTKKPELWQFIYSLSIEGVGKKAAKDLAQRYHSLDNLLKANESELLEMEDMGEITVSNILDFITNSESRDMIYILQKLGVEPKPVEITGEKFKGMTFVITGTLKNPRNYYQDIIESNGGKVSGSVSKKTNVVLIGESAGSKETKARKLVNDGVDIKILDTEEKIKEFLEL